MEEKKAVMGRPRKEVNWDKLDRACKYKLHLKDCAYLVDMSPRTLEERIREEHDMTFREYRDKNLAETKQLLVAKIIELGVKKDNVTALIFALKNMNKWSDKVEETIKTDSKDGITFNIVKRGKDS